MGSNALVQAAGNMSVGELIGYVAIAVSVVMALFSAGKLVFKLLEKYRKKRNAVDDTMTDFEKLKKNDETMEKSINSIVVAVRQILADRLNQRIKTYYSIGYIPEDEFENFQHQYTAYKEVGGNGEMELRYGKCVHDLPVQAKTNDQKQASETTENA